MKFIAILTLFALFVLPGSSASAQETIPACTVLEVAEVRDILVEFAEEYTEVASNLSTYIDDGEYIDALSEVAELQSEWWDETYPELPRCAGMVEASMAFGRAVDSMLIMISMTQSSLNMLNSDDSGEKLDGALIARFAQEYLNKWIELNGEIGPSTERILPR